MLLSGLRTLWHGTLWIGHVLAVAQQLRAPTTLLRGKYQVIDLSVEGKQPIWSYPVFPIG